MNLAYPFTIRSGRTAVADSDAHVRQMLELLLFTAQGERVNRPDFGCGLTRIVFAPNGRDRAASAQLLLQAEIQRWLGDVIELRAIDVAAEDSVLRVRVQYVLRQTGEPGVAEFTGPAGSAI